LADENLIQSRTQEYKAMATNLVSLIMKFMTPDMIGRFASSLGLDRNDTSSAIGAGVPALLAAFAGVANKSGGPQKLADAARQEVGTLDKFESMVGAKGQTSAAERGSKMLASLLGDRDQTALTSAVSKYSGLGLGAGGSLLGALTPVVMGAIAQQQGTRGLDGGGIASLLEGQKDNIADAIPSGFGRLLGSTGMLDSLGDSAKRAVMSGSETTRAAAASVARTLDDTRRSGVAAASAGTNWLLWAIPALAIAALLFYLLGRPAEQVVQQGVNAVQSLTVGGVDIGRQATDSISSLRSALGGITDPVSAQAALPRLQAATAQIDKVSGMVGQLSDGQRKVLSGLVSPVMPTLNQLFDRVLAIPGVAEIVKPTIDVLRTKLATLTA
jgi:Bacterial protein of unknown function (DUF937)